MEQQVVQEFNAESGKWDVMPPEAPVEAKPAVEPPADVDDPPSKATPAVEAKAVPDAKVAKPRNDPQARIDQVIAKQKDAERRLADAERRAEDAERRAAATKEPVTEPAKAAATSDDFPSLTRWLEQHPESANSDDPLRDYNRAFYTHMRNEERKQEADAKQSAHVEQTFATKVHTFSTKYADAITADPDRESRIDKGLLQVRPYSLMTAADKAIIRNLPNPAERDRVAFQCFLADQWIDSEHPVELLEHLSDPKEFQRLASLPPNAVVRRRRSRRRLSPTISSVEGRGAHQG
jgi:hypothetical protein